MGFTIETSVPVLTVFIQGLLSFFSPCVLPLVPLYVSYLSGGAKTVDEAGNIHYPRKKILINTLFFVLGISGAFFLLGISFTALGQFLGRNQILFARVSGIVMILFGLYQLGLFGRSMSLEREHRLPFLLDRWTMGPVPALVLGFTFSFAWTPCVGPTLSSVLLMAGSAATFGKSLLLIGVYTLGFVLPFLAVGLFTGTVLNFFKSHQSVVQYTVKIGAILLIAMGVMTLTGFMNGITGYLSQFGTADHGSAGNTTTQESPSDDGSTTVSDVESDTEVSLPEESGPDETDTEDTSAPDHAETSNSNHMTTEPTEESTVDPDTVPAPTFTLTDQYGNVHNLEDYKGKTIFLNFWGTWCSPCRQEMPDIQQVYEEYGYNKEDLIVLGVAGPGIGREGTIDEITAFLEDNGYTFPVVFDETGFVFYYYGIQAYPTTFMIDQNGNVFGYAQGALTREIMDSIIDQTMRMERSH